MDLKFRVTIVTWCENSKLRNECKNNIWTVANPKCLVEANTKSLH